MSQTEELPLTEYVRAPEEVPAEARPIVVRVVRQCIFALGVGLFVYGLMFLILWMSRYPFHEEPVVKMAWGAGLVALALTLPRRWV